MRFDLPLDLDATALQLLQADVTVAVDAKLDALVARGLREPQRVFEPEGSERGGAKVHGTVHGRAVCAATHTRRTAGTAGSALTFGRRLTRLGESVAADG